MKIKSLIVCFIVAALTYFDVLNWLQICGILFLILIVWKRKQFIIVLQTLPRDVKFLRGLITVIRTNNKLRRCNASPASLLTAQASATPDAPCFIFKGRTWTFKQMEEYSWRVARVFSHMGYVHGDVVALMSSNRPEFVAIWVGLSRLGVVTALINTNLRNAALRHSLNVATPKAVIASSEFCSEVKNVSDVLGENCKLMKLSDHPELEEVQQQGFCMLDELIRNSPSSCIQDLPPPNYHDKLMYIYTSGTTGFPKAAILLNSRFLFVTKFLTAILGLGPKDRIYCPIPLYHTAGMVLGVGPSLCEGTSTVLRDKFSASAYWKECAEYECTVGQYIGEICRYLLAVPPNATDKAHRLRAMVGNGLRPAIWKQFVERFNVPNMKEVYGATEGNANMINDVGKIGAVGYLPNLLPAKLCPVALVRVFPDTCELMRTGPDNLCIPCKPGESGMFVGKIVEGNVTREFLGYVDQSATEKKITRNVFTVGDKYFLTGDILEMDEKGYLYFKDRTGDTFRWKGENVSTAEVEAVISNAIGLRDACVYGVEIPGAEGRAGMATILDTDHSLDVAALGKSLAESLPFYAQPLFLRITHKIEMTGTYKMQKNELQKQAFDPAKIKDRMFFRVNAKGEYQELTPALYDDIITGRIRI